MVEEESASDFLSLNSVCCTIWINEVQSMTAARRFMEMEMVHSPGFALHLPFRSDLIPRYIRRKRCRRTMLGVFYSSAFRDYLVSFHPTSYKSSLGLWC